MGKTAPRYCPSCGKCAEWRLVDVEKKGFSMGKAFVGTLLFGEAGGLLAGSTGKKKVYLSLRSVRIYVRL